MEKKSKSYELLFNLILLALGLYVCIVSIGLGFGTMQEPQAGFFPFLGGSLIIISNLIVMMKRPQAGGTVFQNRRGLGIFLGITVIYLFWLLAIPYLGYVMVTLIASFALSKVMKLEGWIKPLVLSLAIAFFIYLMFDYWLYLDFPRGILG